MWVSYVTLKWFYRLKSFGRISPQTSTSVNAGSLALAHNNKKTRCFSETLTLPGRTIQRVLRPFTHCEVDPAHAVLVQVHRVPTGFGFTFANILFYKNHLSWMPELESMYVQLLFSRRWRTGSPLKSQIAFLCCCGLEQRRRASTCSLGVSQSLCSPDLFYVIERKPISSGIITHHMLSSVNHILSPTTSLFM